MTRIGRGLHLMFAMVVSGCASGADGAREGGAEPVPSEALPGAPWASAPLGSAAVPAVYVEQWTEAQNRRSCALLAPSSTGRSDATPRSAQFSGGWAVAYDLPDLRSAFGVAGTGASVSGHTYDAWPHHVAWADGSWAGYGAEGGTGPNQLAYLRVQGQSCLYNVWSRLGVEHLESLLESLRFVAAPDS